MLRSFTIIILATLSLSSSVSAESRPLLGVQRWDMYSGKGTTQGQELGYLPGEQGFLRPAEWHDRAPFFCRLTTDVAGVSHPAEAGPLWFNYPFSQNRLQAAMDQEIRYAHGAGIDFFIYHGPARTLYRNGWELMNNLDAHMASSIPEAQEMKFVCALYGHPAINYTRSKVTLMMDYTIAHMTKPNWQTVMDGRPLLPVLWPDNFKQQLAAAEGDESMTASEFIAYLRSRVQAAGLKNPYIVGMEVPAKSFQRAAAWKQDGYDAFSDYAGGYGGARTQRDKAPTYAQATETLEEVWAENFVGQALPSIPPCSSMQYPWPRALDSKHQPVDKWYHYQWPEKGDLAARVRAALDFVAAHPEDCEAQTIFMYSWNEHSEGGGLCPTMGKPPEYKPDTRWLDEVAEALSGWKSDKVSTEDSNNDITVACYYFGNYHPNDARNRKQKGEGWSEWELVKQAKPRFEGHQQPKLPLWGYTDESDPKEMERKIDAAADHGIDAFIFDWYYYEDGPFLEKPIDEAYMQADNNSRLKFALMWANHDWMDIHPYTRGEPQKVLYPGKVTPATFDTVCDLVIKRYFLHPSYWKIDDKPYFSIYELAKLVESFGSVEATRVALDRFRERVKAAGLPGLHLNAVVWGRPILPGEKSPANAPKLVADLGFDSVTSYVWIHHYGLPKLETDYNTVRDAYFKYWNQADKEHGVPFYPNVTMGWDSSPRADQNQEYGHFGYPFMNTISDNTPERFEKALALTRERLLKDKDGPRILNINCWNEWTEGSYLEPDTTHGMAYLEAVKAVFGPNGKTNQ